MLAARSWYSWDAGYGAKWSSPGICHHFDVIQCVDFRDGNLGLQPLVLGASRLNGWSVSGKEAF